MFEIAAYTRPATVAEAFSLLSSTKGAALVGGGTFIRLASRQLSLAVDLSGAGLDFIHESEQIFEIGAMTTLRTLEVHPQLDKAFDGIFARAVGQIVGVQLRNLATVGGNVYGRYAFSDLITALLVLDCTVVLHQAGEMTLADFLASNRTGLDILEKIKLRKAPVKASYQSFRNTAGSLPILNVAAVSSDGNIRIAIGARPGHPVLAAVTMADLQDQVQTLGQGETAVVAMAARAAAGAAGEVVLGDDRRASGAYRRLLAQTLVERAVKEVLG